MNCKNPGDSDSAGTLATNEYNLRTMKVRPHRREASGKSYERQPSQQFPIPRTFVVDC